MNRSPETLEHSYRRLTRLFPRTYREAREDEIVSVLLEVAAPGQSQATFGEATDLLRSAGRLWILQAFGPDRASRRAAAAILAVLLPSVFLYGAGMSFRVVTVLPSDAVLGYLRHSPDSAAWLAWAAVAVLLVLRMSKSARALGLLATCIYLGSMGYALHRLGPNPFIHSTAWFAAQATAAMLLLSPQRVSRGYDLVPRAVQLGVGAGAFALGFTHDRWWAVGQGASALWVAAGAALVVGAWLLRTPTGRVIIPVVACLIGFTAATRLWANNIRFDDHSGVAWLHLTDLILLIAVPTLALVALRLFAALLDRARNATGNAGE
jgi:hypothetical protein